MMKISITSLSKNNRNIRRYSVGVFFLLLLFAGIFFHRDYGISWDEPDSRTLGIVNAMYVGKVFGIKAIEQSQEFAPYEKFPLQTYKDKDYGVAFELPAILLERLFRLRDEQKIYYFRHLLTYLVCIFGVFSLYCMSSRRFGDWRIGLFTASLFVLSPRMFAESFYNDKDMVFLAFFAIGLNCAISFILKPNIRTAIFCGFATALAMNVRLIAILLPAIVVFTLLVQLFLSRWSLKKVSFLLGLYIFFSFMMTILFWPWLWSNPIGHLTQAFINMSQFRWSGFPFYLGQYWPVKELPWHYLLVSIAITIPMLVLVLWIIGVVQILTTWFKNKKIFWQSQEQMQDMIFLGVCIVPVLAIIMMQSVVYNGWRHVYFIYPAMLLVATRGFVGIWTACMKVTMPRLALFVKLLLVLSISGSMLVSVRWMMAAHPSQNLFFNSLAGSSWQAKWEVDYWGLSNRQALQEIANLDQRQRIAVWPGSYTPLYYALKMLSEADRNRILVVSKQEEADYIVTNYHGNNAVYDQDGKYTLVSNYQIGSELVYSIYKRK